MPSWDEAGKAEPVSEVETPEADPAPEPEEPVVDEVEPAAVEEPEVSADQPTTVVEPVDQDQPTAVVQLPEPPTAAVPTPPTEPVAFAATAPQTEAGSSGPLKGYLIGVGGLLAVLVAVLVWAFAFADPGTDSTEATGADETSETAGTTAPATDSTDPTGTAEGEVIGAGGQVSDGDVAITSNGVEITPTVSAADNEMLTKTASGEFVVVRLTLLNNGELPATFLADQQVLNAGGQTFNTETESTFYLGGISAVLYPGQPVDVAFAYDVPPGTAPESLEVHGDLASPGVVLPLS
ncbi:DUF4352 domain-containing protein [Mycolicibacterium frederiksbergense]|uniref:DUF4352 domain-containing protein n=1 Tax=Mycolicibacterium frederiksbergense TaxID=117567 RepID=UPI0027E3514A|nr:DUF4352 domain-containing protein [Mycolicibacterium frederiksbergense]